MWKTERTVCERCGHWQVSVHPDCERIECAACGYMMQSVPCPERDFDKELSVPPMGDEI